MTFRMSAFGIQGEKVLRVLIGNTFRVIEEQYGFSYDVAMFVDLL